MIFISKSSLFNYIDVAVKTKLNRFFENNWWENTPAIYNHVENAVEKLARKRLNEMVDAALGSLYEKNMSHEWNSLAPKFGNVHTTFIKDVVDAVRAVQIDRKE